MNAIGKSITVLGMTAFLGYGIGNKDIVSSEPVPNRSIPSYQIGHVSSVPKRYNLRDIVGDSAMGRGVCMPGNAIMRLDTKDFDLVPTEVTSIFGGEHSFRKTLMAYTPIHKNDTIRFKPSSNQQIQLEMGNSEIFNGPYTISATDSGLKISTMYDARDVVPMRIVMSRGNIKDTVDIVEEKDYPPYYVSHRLAGKDSITGKDIVDILRSYEGQYGDYFRKNPKALVCTDAITLIMKTAGIDYAELLRKYNIHGNDYLQRNTSVFMHLLAASGLSEGNTSLFLGGNQDSIFARGGLGEVKPESFGLKGFPLGGLIIFSRYYLTGHQKGSPMKVVAHFGVITDTNSAGIGKMATVTSNKPAPPYTDLIMLVTGRNFSEWYNSRARYLDSDETKEELTYRPYAILDLKGIINGLKRIQAGKKYI